MSEKILVIDDEAKICDLLKKFLEKKGFSVATANSAAEGIEKLQQERPRVVLLDIRMPEIDGLEAIKRIRKIDQRVSIIMATAVTDYDIAKEAIEAGASDYIVKPFDLDYLEKTLTLKISLLLQDEQP